MILGPYPVKYAAAWVKTVHRRLPDMAGAMWCVGLWDGPKMLGLAVVGRPSRMLDVPARSRIHTQIVQRVAVVEGVPNGCSMLYGSCSRSGKAMGLDDMVTYIHLDEPGTSLKASGWVKGGETDGGEWTRPSRKRKKAEDPESKIRWWAPWGKTALALQLVAATEIEAATARAS